MELSTIDKDFAIEMIETARGCPEACLHCGAYSGFKKENLKLLEVPIDTLENNITQEIADTNTPVYHYFAPYMTTHVNTEPLRTDGFLFLAEQIPKRTNNRSKMVAISHGMRAGEANMKERLEAIVELMKEGSIPVFVLTVDSARSMGKISDSYNLSSYTESLLVLKHALSYGRVTASIQGTHNSNSPLYIEKTRSMFAQALDNAKFTQKQRSQLHIDDRSYSKIGRSEELLENTEDSIECDVIPDPEFVLTSFKRDYSWRGMIRFDGKILVQPNRPGKTYGDSVRASLWEEIVC